MSLGSRKLVCPQETTAPVPPWAALMKQPLVTQKSYSCHPGPGWTSEDMNQECGTDSSPPCKGQAHPPQAPKVPPACQDTLAERASPPSSGLAQACALTHVASFTPRLIMPGTSQVTCGQYVFPSPSLALLFPTSSPALALLATVGHALPEPMGNTTEPSGRSPEPSLCCGGQVSA